LLDRFKSKPLDDAKRENHKDIESFLSFKKGCVSLKGKNPCLVALGSKDGRTIETERVLRVIEQSGVSRSDIRIVQAFQEFPKVGLLFHAKNISPHAFLFACVFVQMLNSTGFDKIFSECAIVRKCLTGELVVRDFDVVKRKFEDLFNAAAPNKSGVTCQSIGALAAQDPEVWAVGVCSVDGQRMSFGDCKQTFTVQSCCKAVTYCIALEENGYEKVNRHIGREPSGRRSDEMVLDRRTTPAIPHNPFVNAGAIMACALVQPQLETSEERVQYCLKNYWSRLTAMGSETPTYDYITFESELVDGDRNRCLTYMMAESKSFPPEVKSGKDLLENLDFYFKSCSIQQNANSLSIVAGTLANGGVCPVTGERIFEGETVRDCLSLMYSCGMYDYSGEFAFKIGLPSKSGAAGAMLVVIPNKMGICTWSPRLDQNGNSARGLDFLERLSEQFLFHIYDRLPSKKTKKLDVGFHKGGDNERDLGTLIEAASQGDIQAFRLFHNLHGPEFVNTGDYDGRTALHLACTEGHQKIVEYIVAHPKLSLQAKDRWGTTPLNDARAANHHKIVSILQQAIATRTLQ